MTTPPDTRPDLDSVVNRDEITTVGDLIAALTAYNPAIPVRIATQSGYLMEHTLGRVVCTPDTAQGDGSSPNDTHLVSISTGNLTRCLPAAAVDALGWVQRRTATANTAAR